MNILRSAGEVVGVGARRRRSRRELRGSGEGAGCWGIRLVPGAVAGRCCSDRTLLLCYCSGLFYVGFVFMFVVL